MITTKKKYIIIVFSILALIILFIAKQNNGYHLKTYQITQNEWGYQILQNGTTIIKQEQIPAVSGQKKFTSKSDAKKCGELVLTKIRNNRFPAISHHELDSLGISY